MSSGMTKEAERCRLALEEAQAGRTVALVSSGDPGVYGMAGLALEMAHSDGINIPIQIISGVTSATAAAASLGAPLMLDFACISLSDILVPWEKIEQRLEAAAQGDLVVALYNPRSKKRVRQLKEAREIFLKYRTGQTPVGVVTMAQDETERIEITDLDNFLSLDIGMRTMVIICNSTSKRIGNHLVTPRGYPIGGTSIKL